MTFTRMDRSTKADWDRIAHESVDAWSLVPDRILAMLRALADITTGFAVDQLQHALQTATRAERAGADDDVVVAGLCHDIGKAISEPNHPAVAAALLHPFVREEVAWMIEVHQDFQGRHYYDYLGKDPDARDRHRGHVAYALAEQFADDWDQASFDPDYDTLPLEHFEPLVRRVFAAPRRI
jgi:predicted HD phosphohydrolase